MQIHTLARLDARRAVESRAWLEFLRVPSMSMGLYHLKAGQVDEQKPHGEDEAYYILCGRARFACDEEIIDVAAGSILFVERRLEHRFIEIIEDLTALVIFAPAEGSLPTGSTAIAGGRT